VRTVPHARRLRGLSPGDDAAAAQPHECATQALTKFGVELERWSLERLVEMTTDYLRRKEDAKFEAAFAEIEA
jgi:hypothetical protein